jgi:hypothetical protein
MTSSSYRDNEHRFPAWSVYQFHLLGVIPQFHPPGLSLNPLLPSEIRCFSFSSHDQCRAIFHQLSNLHVPHSCNCAFFFAHFFLANTLIIHGRIAFCECIQYLQSMLRKTSTSFLISFPAMCKGVDENEPAKKEKGPATGAPPPAEKPPPSPSAGLAAIPADVPDAVPDPKDEEAKYYSDNKDESTSRSES